MAARFAHNCRDHDTVQLGRSAHLAIVPGSAGNIYAGKLRLADVDLHSILQILLRLHQRLTFPQMVF